MDASEVTGIFTLAGTVSGLAVGILAEYLRERWARGRDKEVRMGARVAARDDFQRTCLLQLQESVLNVSLELAEALSKETADTSQLTKRMLETNAIAQRVFDSEARSRVNKAVGTVQPMVNRMKRRGEIEITEVEAWTEALYAAQERIRELLEDIFQA
jgi:hypothetical protein